MGYVYLDARDYDKAQQSYQRALDLATQINSKQDIIDTTMSLALVSERTGKLEQARDYADKTIALAPADGNRLDILYPMLVKGHVAARLHDNCPGRKNISRDRTRSEKPRLSEVGGRALSRPTLRRRQQARPGGPAVPSRTDDLRNRALFSAARRIVSCHFPPTPPASTTITSTFW